MKQILAACALALLGFLPGEDTKQFSDWSPPVKVAGINSPYIDSCAAISKDGLSLFFSSTRQNPTNSLNRDLYVSQRESKDASWGLPEPILMLNSPLWDSCPALSLDEHRLYFSRRDPNSCGKDGLEDIWVSRRHDRREDLGWEQPVNLGCEADGYVNSSGRDLTPTLFEDEQEKVLMYFSSDRPGSEISDIYQSEMRGDDTFGPATKVVELSGPYSDLGVTVRRDGLEVIILSNRGGNHNSMDFWMATRESTKDPWSEPVFVPSLDIAAYPQGRIALSFDGCELYFTAWAGSSAAGGYEIYVATRERLRGKKSNFSG